MGNVRDNSGHRKRLRERYEEVGCEGLKDYEIIELLLTYSIPRSDVKPIAKELIENYKKVENILKADPKKLKSTKGLGESAAVFLNLIGNLVRVYFQEDWKKDKKDVVAITGKNDLINYLRSDIGFSDREEFKAVYLNTANHVIASKTLFQGTLDRSIVYPREIVKEALLLEAKSVIFAHNHPSGNRTPSKKDIELTNSMKDLFEEMGLRLLEHIIITRDSYFSFLEEGLLDH